MCNHRTTRSKARTACNYIGHFPDYRAQQLSRTCNVMLDRDANFFTKLHSATVLAVMLSR